MSPLMPHAQPPMDPRKAECMSRYLYGSGYMAKDDVRMAIVRGAEVKESSFCNDDCPVKKRCEEMHRERTAELLPEEVERFEREVHQGKKRGASRNLVSMLRMRSGSPDPYMKVAMENYRLGAEGARRIAGSPIVRRG